MRALDALRDPVGIALAAATAVAIVVVQLGPVLAAMGAGAVLAFRVAAGALLERRMKPGTAPAEPAHSTPDRWFAPLTRKEAEVATLVAEGLTNREVAARLVLSERTIDNHVLHIMNKLDVHSRTQIGVWVVERRMAADRNRAPVG